MDYEPLEGDIVEIRTEKGAYRGKLMPKHILGRDDVILIKLDNGYNIGFSQDDIVSMKTIKRAEKKERIERQIRKGKGPKIALFGTGGTIASYVDYRTGAVHPAISSEDFLFSVPELADMADIDAKMLFSVLSEDMTPEHWEKMAAER